MPTSYTDQFFQMDPANPPAVGTLLNFSVRTLTDQNDDFDFDRFNNDSLDGFDISQSYPGDTVTINVTGVGNVTYTGITFYLSNGTTAFTPTDGQVLQNGTFVSSTWVNTQGPLLVSQLGPPCFLPGTLIETAAGPRPVESLKPGDLVLTRDRGFQPILMVVERRCDGRGDLAPIRFEAGVMGNVRALTVSPQHRMLIEGWQAELHFGETEVLVPAKHLVNGTTIRPEPTARVRYLHLLLEMHEIIYAEGTPTESFDLASDLAFFDRRISATIQSAVADPGRAREAPTVRPVPRGQEALALGL